MEQKHDPSSPLFHWSKGEMRDAIDRLRRQGHHHHHHHDHHHHHYHYHYHYHHHHNDHQNELLSNK
eukprot:1660394-Amphidinium_carterae.1